MARRPSLSPFAEPAPPVSPATPAPARPSSTRGRYHLGGYFDPDEPLVQDFRMLAARTHRRQQDLLTEAIQDLVDKHKAAEAFGR